MARHAVDEATPVDAPESLDERDVGAHPRAGVDSVIEAAVASLAARHPAVGAVYGVVASDGRLGSVFSSGMADPSHSHLASISFAPARSYTDALRSGDIVAVADAATDPRTSAVALALHAASVRAILATSVGDTRSGVCILALCDPHPRTWDPEDMAALSTLAATLERLAPLAGVAAPSVAATEAHMSARGAPCLLWEARVQLAATPPAQGRRLTWDRAMCDEDAAEGLLPLGASADHPYSAAWEAAIGPLEMARLEGVAEEAILGGDPTYETEFSCVDAAGSQRWLRERVSVTQVSGRVWHCVGVCVDITEAKASELALRADERLYRGVFGQSPVGMAVVGSDFRIVDANSRLCEMLGTSRDALRGARFADFTHPDDIATDVEMARQLFAGEIPRYAVEKRYARHGGEFMWGRLTATVIGGARGAPARGLNVVEDITSDKHAEGRAGDVREELERRIDERTSELEDQLAERIETVGELRKTMRERSRLMRQVLTVQEEERTRIARELHDQTGQALSSLLIGLRVVESASSLDAVRARGRQLREVTSSALDSVRTLAFDLRPSSLDNLGLSAGVERDAGALGSQIGVSVVVHADEGVDGVLDMHAEAALYRVIHSALTNIGRHAEATAVSILLRRRADGIAAVIEDDGVGFDVVKTLAGPIEGRFGLLAMEERLRPFGGEVSFESTPRGGVTVYASIPSERPKDALDT